MAEDAQIILLSLVVYLQRMKKNRDNVKGYALEIDAVTGTTITGNTFANGPVCNPY